MVLVSEAAPPATLGARKIPQSWCPLAAEQGAPRPALTEPFPVCVACRGVGLEAGRGARGACSEVSSKTSTPAA